MSTFEVTAEQLTIHPHPNADALELAQVGLYRAVVAKGQYRTGDVAVYIPEQAILPAGLIVELGLDGKLAGKGKDRVKAVRLRGEVSQGIVCSPAAVTPEALTAGLADRRNFAGTLGVVKWVPEVPVHLDGQVMAAADLLAWVDIENVKRYPDVFTAGEPVTATEKVHGSCVLLSYLAGDKTVLVSSKGFGAKRQSLVESEDNLYWRAVRGHDVDMVAAKLAVLFGASRVGIFAEVYGAGIQDLTYGVSARAGLPGYAVFDIAVEVDGNVRWLSQDELVDALAATGSGLTVVPRLYDGPFDLAALTVLAEGRETLSGTASNIREGVVIRPKVERYSDVLGGRAVVKLVGEGYLLRKGGTEYE